MAAKPSEQVKQALEGFDPELGLDAFIQMMKDLPLADIVGETPLGERQAERIVFDDSSGSRTKRLVIRSRPTSG